MFSFIGSNYWDYCIFILRLDCYNLTIPVSNIRFICRFILLSFCAIIEPQLYVQFLSVGCLLRLILDRLCKLLLGFSHLHRRACRFCSELMHSYKRPLISIFVLLTQTFCARWLLFFNCSKCRQMKRRIL